MRVNWIFSALLLLFAHCCYADYVAAVVEYSPLTSTIPQKTLEENVNNYVYQIGIAKVVSANLIVFPEYGLTGLTSNPENYSIEIPDAPASNFSANLDNMEYILLKLSDAAKEHAMYVVVNLLEKTNNTRNETIYHNTNLVFGSNGTLVAKYRKINLYEEPKLTPGNKVVTFTTDFGTFGLMTCADILYNNPAQTMLVNTGVTDVIFPTAWTSYYPFYVSMEVQVGYALANKVNLLAANINRPTEGIGGSGIYTSDGTVLRRVLTDRPLTSPMSATVQAPSLPSNSFSLMGFDILDNNTQELANFKNLTNFQYGQYNFKSLDLSQENITQEVCHGTFCCTFNITALRNDTNSSEVYKLMAFSGKAKFDTQEAHVKHCDLVACLTNDVSSCGVRPSTPYTTRFRQILVWGNFKTQPEEFFRPVSLQGNLQPIYNVTYLENGNNENFAISFNITQPASNVVLFGLYAKGGVETLSVSLALVAFIIAIQRLF